MGQVYSFDGKHYEIGAPGFTESVAQFYEAKRHPFCMCDGTGVEVYLARRHEQFVIHRMPNTGPKHAPDCDHFEPDEDLSGLGQLLGHAIQNDEESGITKLKLGFPLSRGTSRLATETIACEKADVGADGTRMTLRGFLHYTWNDAGLTRWFPRMQGKRNWHVVYNCLRESLISKDAKGHHLSELVFVPEMFNLEKKYEIEQRRNEFVSRAAPATKQSMILIAEVKDIVKSAFGEKIVCKHLRGWELYLDDDLARRMHRNFEVELGMLESFPDGHLMVCATFELDRSERARVRFLTFMPVNEYWIPYENRDDRSFINRCIESRRGFVKQMRMNYSTSRPIANLILTDTRPLGTAIYLKRRSMTPEYEAILGELMARPGNVHMEMDIADPLPVSVFGSR